MISRRSLLGAAVAAPVATFVPGTPRDPVLDDAPYLRGFDLGEGDTTIIWIVHWGERGVERRFVPVGEWRASHN